MPKFTITISQKAVDKLQPHVQRSNETNGTSLTLLQWLHLHLQELAIGDDFQVAIQALVQQQKLDAENTLQAAVRTTRDEMLTSLDK